MRTLTGTCLCGAVAVTARGASRDVIACHCTQCRKLSGHFSASLDAEAVETAGEVATWAAPGGAVRAFCPVCGSKLWFRAPDGAWSVEAGILEAPTGARLAAHIFTACKGDYYRLADGLPQHQDDLP